MWAKIIEIIEKRWEKHNAPRNKFYRQMLTLYFSMINCHENYLKARKGGRNKHHWEDQWYRDLVMIDSCLQILNQTLEIHDNRLLLKLKEYYITDRRIYTGRSKKRLEKIKEDEADFETAISALRGILQNNLTAEEIFSLTKDEI